MFYLWSYLVNLLSPEVRGARKNERQVSTGLRDGELAMPWSERMILQRSYPHFTLARWRA